MRDRKDTRGTKYTYYNDYFLILHLVKSRLIYILLKKGFNLFKIIIFGKKNYNFNYIK